MSAGQFTPPESLNLSATGALAMHWNVAGQRARKVTIHCTADDDPWTYADVELLDDEGVPHVVRYVAARDFALCGRFRRCTEQPAPDSEPALAAARRWAEELFRFIPSTILEDDDTGELLTFDAAWEWAMNRPAPEADR